MIVKYWADMGFFTEYAVKIFAVRPINMGFIILDRGEKFEKFKYMRVRRDPENISEVSLNSFYQCVAPRQLFQRRLIHGF